MRRVNLLFVLMMLVGTLYYVVYCYDDSRLLTYLAIIPVLLAPLCLKKTKYRLDMNELFIYYLFVFLADFLGCVVNLYNEIWWYDLFAHFLSGIFTAMVGRFLLDKMKVKERTKWFDFLFEISFVMLIASIWEFFEFGVDYLLDMNLQHQLDTGIVDTMEDMLAAFVGGIGIGLVSIKKV